jgi:hypothetical protein
MVPIKGGEFLMGSPLYEKIDLQMKDLFVK